LSGTLVDGVSNRPLAGMEVSLQTETWKAVGDPLLSDAQGRFAFGGIAAGEYILSAEGNGFGTVHYGEAPDPGWVSTVKVGADKTVVFRMMPRGGIEGVVRDEFGDPMAGANVSVVRPLWRDGRTTTAVVGQKPTDDRGRYRFGNLAPGNYTVCTGGDHVAAPVPGPVDFATRVENRYYTRTCNRTFQLAPGQHAQVDISPLTAPTASVRGHVRNVAPPMGVSVHLEPEDENSGVQSNYASVDVTQGTFAIRGVSPGRYRLWANTGYMTDGALTHLAAELPVDVGGSDVDGLELTLDSGSALDMVFHGVAENGIDPASLSPMLRRADSTRNLRGVMRNKDGVFHVDGLGPGSYWLSASTPSESCVDSVKLGDQEVRGRAFDVAAGAALRLEVSVSKNCGSIQMRAKRDGEVAPDAKVVLLISGTAKDPGELREDFANDEGEYSFSGLTPGRYLVWAWAVQGKGAIAGPASLAAVEQQATVVEVKAGNPAHVDVPLLADEGKGK